MTSTELDLLAPLAAPLPPLPKGEVLSSSQWTTLLAVADTLIPSIGTSTNNDHPKLILEESEYAAAVQKLQTVVPNEAGREAISHYLQESAGSTPGFRESVQRTFGSYLREDALKGIRVILSALDTRAGCLILTGYSTFFHLQPVKVRQQIIQSWTQSYLPPLRQLIKSLGALVISIWVKQSPTLGSILGFPRNPVHGKPGKGFDYDFIRFSAGDEPEILETDVVIVGSGCGGGVCAKNIAEAGHQVLVVERAYHFPPEYFPMTSADGYIHLFHNGGVDTSDDSSIAVLAGQAWGGGGTVNWSASLQTQAFVRQEWADGGLSFFTSSEYQESLDRVCRRMGVSGDHVDHNPNNKFILDGARRLGYSAKVVPQNTGGKKHYCGYCTFGCAANEKQGPVASFLPDAAKAGARFMEGFEAEKVLFDQTNGKKTASGLQGTWKSRDGHGGVSGDDRIARKITIKAKRVIISCGTLNSPLLLLRSGLNNPQIGRNLHLHPVTLVSAVFPQEIRPWEGPILTTLCDEFQNLDQRGHGAKIEAMTMLPSWVLPFQPWHSGLDFKVMASQHSHTVSQISLVRDRDTGRVYPDPIDGKCRIAYTPSAFDKKHALEGVLAMTKILYIAGAKRLVLASSAIPPFTRADDVDEKMGVNEPLFQAWLALIRKNGLGSPDTSWGSAHQMGTCRMADSERKGVVDPQGKVWEAEGLYVADASVFPSASGVNPMVTNMAISDWISRGIARGM
ncbi:MAG: hypothetical protein Q9214_004288 [Letrouitia sp. 1 TL-2023]